MSGAPEAATIWKIPETQGVRRDPAYRAEGPCPKEAPKEAPQEKVPKEAPKEKVPKEAPKVR